MSDFGRFEILEDRLLLSVTYAEMIDIPAHLPEEALGGVYVLDNLGGIYGSAEFAGSEGVDELFIMVNVLDVDKGAIVTLRLNDVLYGQQVANGDGDIGAVSFELDARHIKSGLNLFEADIDHTPQARPEPSDAEPHKSERRSASAILPLPGMRPDGFDNGMNEIMAGDAALMGDFAVGLLLAGEVQITIADADSQADDQAADQQVLSQTDVSADQTAQSQQQTPTQEAAQNADQQADIFCLVLPLDIAQEAMFQSSQQPRQSRIEIADKPDSGPEVEMLGPVDIPAEEVARDIDQADSESKTELLPARPQSNVENYSADTARVLDSEKNQVEAEVAAKLEKYNLSAPQDVSGRQSLKHDNIFNGQNPVINPEDGETATSGVKAGLDTDKHNALYGMLLTIIGYKLFLDTDLGRKILRAVKPEDN